MSIFAALIKGWAVWCLGAVAVFAVLFLVYVAADKNPLTMVLILMAGVAAGLVLVFAWNSLKKKR